MGDIGTHAGITQHVVRQLQQVARRSIPDVDFTYLELGNFLTDLSQVRDPSAFHGAREGVRQEARTQAGVLLKGPVGVDAWADGMFGVATKGSRHGWLPEFLRLVAYGMTHEVFDKDGLALGAAVAAAAGRKVSPVVPAHPLDAGEVSRVLGERFTQYYPHEHVDFPPLRDDEKAGHRSQEVFRRDRSGLVTYLERDLLALSEELSKLEQAWVQARLAGITQRQRQDFLLRLGHCLHAVEDFFFHSNFAEVRQMRFVRKLLRHVDPATREGRDALLEQLLLTTGLDVTSVHLRRLMFRRLRYPVLQGKALSVETSDDGSDMVFTGGFGRTDVWHTLGGALEAVEERIEDEREKWGDLFPHDSKLVLMRLLFSADARRNLVRSGAKALAEHRDLHATQVIAGEYPTAIEKLHARKVLSELAAASMAEAFRLDQDREQEFKFLPGPGGVLISMLALMQAERDESARASRSFDANEQSIDIPRSDNDSSQENVGTHSLMSKDSTDKEPFRPDAVAFASHASAGVATALASRLESMAPVTNGVDWDAVLHFYVRFPAYPSEGWEEEMLVQLRREGDGFVQPGVQDLASRASFPLLGPNRGADKLAARRAGRQTAELEALYARFESDP